MSYIDDWHSTPALVRAYLEAVCSNAACDHLRYQHGDARTQLIAGAMWSKEVVHEPGRCSMCRCKVFTEPGAITEDDVLDAVAAVEALSTLAQMFGEGKEIV